VVEVDRFEGDGAAQPAGVAGVRLVDDVGQGVLELQRRLEADELLLQVGQRATDGGQRLVDRGDVGEHDEQLADRQLVHQHQVRAVAEDEGGTESGGDVDDQAEHRLTHGQADPRLDRLRALPDEAAVLVTLPAEGDDDPHHRHRLVDDRERLTLHVTHAANARLDLAAIPAGRVV